MREWQSRPQVRIEYASAGDATSDGSLETLHRIGYVGGVRIGVQVQGQAASIGMAKPLRQHDGRHAPRGVLRGEEAAKVV